MFRHSMFGVFEVWYFGVRSKTTWGLKLLLLFIMIYIYYYFFHLENRFFKAETLFHESMPKLIGIKLMQKLAQN